jgi:hypothetical protein
MNKIIVFCFPLIASVFVIANIGPQGFGQFKNHYFIETGTYGGAGLMKAIQSGAFQDYRSIEFEAQFYQNAKNKFRGRQNVRLYHGDSAKGLWNMIKDIDRPATFWLDAHVYPPRKDGGKNCPLIEELEQISWHPIKTHTILIDDMHCAGTEAFDYLTKGDLIKKIKKINPNYQIFYIPGGDRGEYPQNVMVALIP